MYVHCCSFWLRCWQYRLFNYLGDGMDGPIIVGEFHIRCHQNNIRQNSASRLWLTQTQYVTVNHRHHDACMEIASSWGAAQIKDWFTFPNVSSVGLVFWDKKLSRENSIFMSMTMTLPQYKNSENLLWFFSPCLLTFHCRSLSSKYLTFAPHFEIVWVWGCPWGLFGLSLLNLTSATEIYPGIQG